MKILITFFVLLLLAGCTTTGSATRNWIGQSESDLVVGMGAPHRAIDTKNGLRVLTWNKMWGPMNKICEKTFTVDKDGKVISGTDKNCPPFDIF